ncbi:cytochrome c biogenesis protein ResB [Desulfitibacter alkalitolerans]|uniref:cytochrome c biogenesis protein ResB n=1 Tax=Desulfitibacter alkalitolerans TaxID=264641 RepID=UPI000489D0CF|nr:cytochrome c biogenesis protein ResB [Desulfitibacter alkalitolerans]
MIKFLSSIKLAVILIAALVVTSIIATLNPNVNIYKSIWFRGLILIFTFNLLICSVQRIPVMLGKLFKKLDSQTEFKQYEREISIQDVTVSEIQLRKLLGEKGYRVKEENTTDKLILLANKGFLNLLAPHLLHISLIIVLLGAFLGSFGANDRVMAFVGNQADIPSHVAKGMAIQVNNFQTLYDSNGAIDNWVSDITIFVNGKEVANGTTRVNKPFKYKGVVFYQSSYGYNHLIGISGEEEEYYAIPDKKTFNVGDTLFNIQYLRGGSLIKLYEGRNVIDARYLQQGDTIEFPGGEILEYADINPYTVLAVKVDPGTNVVMVGFILMIISSSMFWSGRYREIHAVLDKKSSKVFVKVVCKNTDIKNQIYTELATKVGEGQ